MKYKDGFFTRKNNNNAVFNGVDAPKEKDLKIHESQISQLNQREIQFLYEKETKGKSFIDLFYTPTSFDWFDKSELEQQAKSEGFNVEEVVYPNGDLIIEFSKDDKFIIINYDEGLIYDNDF